MTNDERTLDEAAKEIRRLHKSIQNSSQQVMSAEELDALTDTKITGNRIWTILKETGIKVGEIDIQYGFRYVAFDVGEDASEENEYSHCCIEIRDKKTYKNKLKIFMLEKFKEDEDDPIVVYETDSVSKFILFLMKYFKQK